MGRDVAMALARLLRDVELAWPRLSLPRCLFRLGMPVSKLNVPLPWLPTDDGPAKSSSSRDAGLEKGDSPAAPPPNEPGPGGARYSVKDGLSVNAGREELKLCC